MFALLALPELLQPVSFKCQRSHAAPGEISDKILISLIKILTLVFLNKSDQWAEGTWLPQYVFCRLSIRLTDIMPIFCSEINCFPEL